MRHRHTECAVRFRRCHRRHHRQQPQGLWPLLDGQYLLEDDTFSCKPTPLLVFTPQKLFIAQRINFVFFSDSDADTFRDRKQPRRILFIYLLCDSKQTAALVIISSVWPKYF